jgi:hypothetical protein
MLTIRIVTEQPETGNDVVEVVTNAVKNEKDENLVAFTMHL